MCAAKRRIAQRTSLRIVSHMKKHLVCDVPQRRVAIGWLSFQPDNSISFGLNDRAYVSPRFRDRISIWNAYNRVCTIYEVPTNPTALEAVQNPHFTYHPDILFHLKSNDDLTREDQEIFRGIADVPITLEQDCQMPWIRATSAPIDRLQTHSARPDAIETECLALSAPSERASVRVEIDFVRLEVAREVQHQTQWCIPWGKVALKLSLRWTFPQIATLAWFHFH